jgi:protein-S-isoprenylcysteine O-methyltransferase Ste14
MTTQPDWRYLIRSDFPSWSTMPEADSETAPDIPGVIAPPPLIFLVPLVLGVAIGRWVPLTVLPRTWAWGVGAVCLALSGLVISAVRAFRRAKTRPEPWKPTTALVTDGPYRFTRNPMYLGFALVYVGVTLLVNTLWPLLLLPVVLTVMHFLVIRREERYLERKFGDDYRAYLRTVRRWI